VPSQFTQLPKHKCCILWMWCALWTTSHSTTFEERSSKDSTMRVENLGISISKWDVDSVLGEMKVILGYSGQRPVDLAKRCRQAQAFTIEDRLFIIKEVGRIYVWYRKQVVQHGWSLYVIITFPTSWTTCLPVLPSALYSTKLPNMLFASFDSVVCNYREQTKNEARPSLHSSRIT